ncbi:MAG: hypothetical protein ABSG43_05760 [Solirubrobacteraceae bacterium]
MAYPVGDLLLAALVLGMLALRDWRPDRTWGLLAGGFMILAVADCLYALQIAGGASTPTAMTNLCYVAAVALLAIAAWQPDSETTPGRFEGWSVLAGTGFLRGGGLRATAV